MAHFLPVTSAPGNTYRQQLFFLCLFVYKLGARMRQRYRQTNGETSRQTDRRARPTIQCSLLQQPHYDQQFTDAS